MCLSHKPINENHEASEESIILWAKKLWQRDLFRRNPFDKHASLHKFKNG